ncbi:MULTISPECIES: pantoate--beta-alanine ligase [Legionella]|uniref:Pantothenate synthetase n=1 Tax=Legionella septentrionalis TaxID=2498109 RepID=A0A3S0VBP0_9GAMM|nr:MULTISPECIES: pantoate--beta-alanine ligase [Legionella]MCP0913917.1 pantoate--beta-alanine ligase [Legionella sp. 27cVA30]RUQ90418.1 pantoate--beta-alanine ligase [Legionella septentrionalis]RUR00069.1 pantoate--beta-alanine ligase [Legionella septentrionalis]RUR10765.1 pantoate--beta-alanine ligase [Legionella septentrionalis]RUR16482.1 pantoate--beta-alanine ligase [Legionella septentrionalis]
MHIINDLAEWVRIRATLPHTNTIGFVPTMGNLHAGHASLYDCCRQENDITIASIFVNPTQFNQRGDFIHYPRSLEADLSLLTSLGVDYCLLPDEQTLYADGYRYQIHENELCGLMEGRQRPGHFTGVLTVVMKLFNLVKPSRAYFGEKDFQQLQLIQDMVAAFFMDIEIKACPTIREKSGLAFSSRNNRLNSEQRARAEKFAQIFLHGSSCEAILTKLKENAIQVDYVEEHANRRFAAVKIDEIRLIDNYLITVQT